MFLVTLRVFFMGMEGFLSSSLDGFTCLPLFHMRTVVLKGSREERTMTRTHRFTLVTIGTVGLLVMLFLLMTGEKMLLQIKML